MRVTGEQGLAAARETAGHGPGIAALEDGDACQGHGLGAQFSDAGQGLPVRCGQLGALLRPGGRAENAQRLPFEVEHPQVVRAELVAYEGQHRLGPQCCSEAVGHVAAHGQCVFRREGVGGDPQQIEFQRQRAGFLVFVDAVEVGHQGLPGRAGTVHLLHPGLRAGTQTERAEQAVGVDQLGPEDLGQFAAGEPAHHLHLEQAVLRVQEAQGPVEVGFIRRPQVRHAALVPAYFHRGLQLAEHEGAMALRQLAAGVPDGCADGDGCAGQGDNQQDDQDLE